MFAEKIKKYYDDEMNVIKKLNVNEIDEAVGEIVNAYYRDAYIYIFGNGGSAATASHYANDFNKGICENLQKKFNVICLCDNFSTVTAIANDISYEEVFRFQLKGRLKKDDLVIGISGSGNSKNVINAIKYANEIGTNTIGISGYQGGELKKLTKYHMHCPIEDMQIAEDIHITFAHMMYRVISDYIMDSGIN